MVWRLLLEAWCGLGSNRQRFAGFLSFFGSSKEPKDICLNFCYFCRKTSAFPWSWGHVDAGRGVHMLCTNYTACSCIECQTTWVAVVAGAPCIRGKNFNPARSSTICISLVTTRHSSRDHAGNRPRMRSCPLLSFSCASSRTDS